MHSTCEEQAPLAGEQPDTVGKLLLELRPVSPTLLNGVLGGASLGALGVGCGLAGAGSALLGAGALSLLVALGCAARLVCCPEPGWSFGAEGLRSPHDETIPWERANGMRLVTSREGRERLEFDSPLGPQRIDPSDCLVVGKERWFGRLWPPARRRPRRMLLLQILAARQAVSRQRRARSHAA